jgi:hypothetical protein
MKLPILTSIAALWAVTSIIGCGGSGGTAPPAVFSWRTVETNQFLGELQPFEQIFRTKAEFDRAYPNRPIDTDWAKNSIGFISLGEKPSTHDSIKVLEVKKTATEVVIRYSIEPSQFGLLIFCQPGAYVEFSKTNLPVRFEKLDVFRF